MSYSVAAEVVLSTRQTPQSHELQKLVRIRTWTTSLLECQWHGVADRVRVEKDRKPVLVSNAVILGNIVPKTTSACNYAARVSSRVSWDFPSFRMTTRTSRG